MEDCDQIEHHLEWMLNSFKEAVSLLGRPNPEPIDQELERLSKQIVENSRGIDRVVEVSRLFDQPEEDLDDRLRQLDEENKRNQEQFEIVKTSTGIFCLLLHYFFMHHNANIEIDKVKESFNQTFDQIMDIKLGEGKGMNVESIF